jgi:biopolymer transport protein ExbB/TolQ
MSDQSLFDIILQGGVAMWVILLCSVLALAVAVERLIAIWSLRRDAKELTQTVTRCLGRQAVAEARTACERSRSPLADVYLVGFERRGRSTEGQLIAAVDRERQRINLGLKSRLWILGTIGAIAPFVGLYGTVVGIMGAFDDISAMGQVSITVVGKPIAEALVATAAGILVAVEAVVIYNFFNQHLARVATEFKMHVEEYLEVLLETPTSATGPGTRAASVEGGSDGPGKAA